MRLKDKICVVTAAGQGIGRASTLAYAQEGAQVWALDINEAALQSLKAEHENIHIHAINLLETEKFSQFFEKLDKIDVLFNCAGWVAAGDVLASSAQDMQKSWDLNVMTMFHAIQAVLPKMLAQGGGSIINMSSAASSVKGVPNRFAYSVSKAAVIGLTKSVAADYVTQGIRCNAICPGTVESPSLHERIAEQAKAQNKTIEEVFAAFVARQPMGRIGRDSEIAALAVYLASDESAFTTGTCQVIDGGWSN
ncbi:SDR family oxidoreductase [Alysiella filiformis]|uniref:2-keto-3-deoxy-L-fuconate dehydrogenase n=1 Tax=Alysiella filiformis DSM 16848 TaxID=1120981 RepID=A0A286E1L9_9NEIS|nr:SDR family oxidoreductase [Alysiella filiformis]QMT30760.1 SDR family oxidoreductase [Alysiella filiformis]UBQ56260.1 SDR family oxidoreductase [Alysiella filiformis DSM 16848]SOD64785.1 2-keto-3-deoxy-L-fuconate dehydrogenase [Alysiella filiformis DSM 16848]